MTTVTPQNDQVSGRYRLFEAIGSGGAATVYRARDEVLGREVAVKIFRAESRQSDDLVRQEREVRMLSTLAHPGLIAVHDAGTQRIEGTLRRFVVMELVSHATLETRLESTGALPPYEVATIGAQIASALSYVHGHGVVHRDVTPANILLADTGASGFRQYAKLGDFGIAQRVEDQRMTSDGTVMGTAAFLSPEQVSGGVIGPPSDVYSLGLVLLEALTGRQEFTGTAIESAIARVNRDPAIPPELDGEWRELLAAMTSRNPADRPGAEDVAAILHGEPSRQLTGSGRRSVAARAHRRASFRSVRARRRRNALLVGAAIVLVVAACALSFALGWLMR